MNIHALIDVLSQTISITFLVLMMLMLIEFIHVKTSGKLFQLMHQKPWMQVLLSATIGLIPGCIGGFAIVSLYTHRVIGFGALLAALIASFGDEALFMFSFMPLKALSMAGILLLIAIISGWIVNKLSYFNRVNESLSNNHLEIHTEHCHFTHSHKSTHYKFGWRRASIMMCVLLFIVAIATQRIGHSHTDGTSIFHIENTHNNNLTNQHIEHENYTTINLNTEQVIFLFISTIVLVLVLLSHKHFVDVHMWNHVIKKHFVKIFLWTFVVLMLIYLLLHYLPLESLANKSFGKIILLSLAILIGIIPQSGPHLIFIFLFVEGMIPFSILLANSIMQEGHAGIPLLAESPMSFVRIKSLKFILALTIGLLGFFVGI